MSLASIADLAERLGLQLLYAWKCQGEVDGVPTSVRTGAYSRLEVCCQLAVPIPGNSVIQERRGRGGGWSLGLGLGDDMLIGTSDAGALGTLLADAQVYPRIVELVRLSRTFDLRDQLLKVEIGRNRPVQDVAYEVRLAGGLARALQWRVLWQWEALAVEWGLEFWAGEARMAGEYDGVSVSVKYTANSPDRTTVTVRLPRPLPPRSHIGHPGVHRDATQVGDPILDPMLAFHSSDPQALSERVRDDAVRGPLLALIREFPGSIVLENEVHLVAPGLMTESVRERIQLALDVARALS